MAKRSGNKKKQVILGFKTNNPDRVIRRCTAKVKKVFGSNIYVDKTKAGDKVYFLLKSDYSISATTSKGARIWLIPFKERYQEPYYWMSITFIFAQLGNEFTLSKIIIVIARGLMTDETKPPIFRAEWDSDGLNTNHAQPHWQISPTQKAEKEIAPETFETFLHAEHRAGSGVGNALESFIHRIHFAMSSQWHTNGDTNIVFTTDEMILNWLGNCITYIKNQLEYLARKTGGTF